jgi:hypothetical protein
MKKFLALTILVTTVSSYASTSREIYDLMYLPNAGTTYGFTTGEYTTVERESDVLGDLELKGFRINQTFGHAFTDRLSLEGSINYTSLEADPDGEAKFDSAKGISDPSVQLKFRAIDEQFRLDFIGGAVVSFMDRETERNGDTNNVQGGHSLYGGAQIGVKADAFQWALGAAIIHNMKATTEFETGAGDVEVEDEANNELLVSGNILNKLTERSILRWNLSARFTESYENDLTPATETPAQTVYSVGPEFQYMASQDLLLRAGVDYQQFNVRSGQIDDADGWTFLGGVNYQF